MWSQLNKRIFWFGKVSLQLKGKLKHVQLLYFLLLIVNHFKSKLTKNKYQCLDGKDWMISQMRVCIEKAQEKGMQKDI